MRAAKLDKADVATHPSKTAFIWNSLLIDGRAMLTEEAIKGVMKEARVETMRANFWVDLSISLYNIFEKRIFGKFQKRFCNFLYHKPAACGTKN